MTRSECIRKFKAAAKRVLRAERELDRATESYDKIRGVAFKNCWDLPRTTLSNPYLR